MLKNSLLYCFFWCLQAVSSTLQIVVHDPLLNKSYTTWHSDKTNTIDQLHQSAIINKKNLKRKSLIEDISFVTKEITVADQKIIRSTPLINGLPTEGIQGIFTNNLGYDQFFYTHFSPPKASFKLNAAECMLTAIKASIMPLIRDPFVENIHGMYEQLWLMHLGELRPVFKIRLPTLSVFDLRDVYVDAETGDIVRIDEVAQAATHNVPSALFVYAPRSSDLKASVKPVSLENITTIEENGFLKGEYISVKNCCKYYTCPKDGPCSDKEKRCALKSHENAQQSRELLHLQTDSLGLDPMVSLSDTISIDTVRCTYLPFAKARYKHGEGGPLGFFETPVDNEDPESEIDKFSEIQAYFSISSFFNHIRLLLNDTTFCLRKEAMECNPDGSPVVDNEGNPVNPYRVFVNQMIPETKISGPASRDKDNFLAQIKEGKGAESNPVVLNQFARIGNAAFVPALSTLKKNTPRADEYLSDLIKPYDHNVFFQGVRDFAYDGDVVFHEFMHAVTASLVGKLNTLGLDPFGIHSEPGSLNEAWSDYFSASMSEKSTIGEYASSKDGFGEASLRNIDNNASCPDDVIGESHNDSLIWSGALWEIRNRVKHENIAPVLEFDRAVLAALASATNSEDFKTQSQKLINSINARPTLGSKVSKIAEDVFTRRHINDCFRAYTLASVNKENKIESRIKNLMLIPSKNQIGLKNYAPAPVQLEIGVPAGARSLTLSWRQFLPGNGAMLGQEATPTTARNMQPLSLVYNTDLPITWKFIATSAKPTSEDKEIEQSPISSIFHQGYWQATIPLDFDSCEQKTMYVSLLSNDFKYVLENIHVMFDIDKSKDISRCDFFGSQRVATNHEGLSCASSSMKDNFLILFSLSLIVLYKCRRRKSPFQA